MGARTIGPLVLSIASQGSGRAERKDNNWRKLGHQCRLATSAALR